MVKRRSPPYTLIVKTKIDKKLGTFYNFLNLDFQCYMRALNPFEKARPRDRIGFTFLSRIKRYYSLRGWTKKLIFTG